MSKIIDCSKVNPASGCGHTIEGKTEEEVLAKAADHAREHGLAPSPELLKQVKTYIEDKPDRAD